uniref:Uncharacterized protein n=1 Tax=Timema poppense TaxID=170557 RepID=A0A7R9DFS7_TIMPO|nr:unnamed protein product [Timema poppensis]
MKERKTADVLRRSWPSLPTNKGRRSEYLRRRRQVTSESNLGSRDPPSGLPLKTVFSLPIFALWLLDMRFSLAPFGDKQFLSRVRGWEFLEMQADTVSSLQKRNSPGFPLREVANQTKASISPHLVWFNGDEEVILNPNSVYNAYSGSNSSSSSKTKQEAVASEVCSRRIRGWRKALKRGVDQPRATDHEGLGTFPIFHQAPTRDLLHRRRVRLE